MVKLSKSLFMVALLVVPFAGAMAADMNGYHNNMDYKYNPKHTNCTVERGKFLDSLDSGMSREERYQAVTAWDEKHAADHRMRKQCANRSFYTNKDWHDPYGQ